MVMNTAGPGSTHLSKTMKKIGTGKKKIDIEPIIDYQSRMVAFTRRKQGLFKKAVKLEEKSGSSVAIVVVSETGQPYLQGSPSLLEQFLASTATADTSSTVTSSSPTTTDAGYSTNTTNSEVKACTNSEKAESLLPLDIKRWVEEFDL